MKVQVRGNWRDLTSFLGLPLKRSLRIRRASAAGQPEDRLRALTDRLHPGRLELVIREMRAETDRVRTYTLISAPDARQKQLPVFRAGQYLSVELEIGGVRVTRPYSISSSPAEAAEQGFLELTVQRREGFAAPYIWDQWRPGVRVRASGPLGEFSYEPLRDRPRLVFLAGGCGITPFRSLWRDIRANHPGVHCTILYGAEREEELVFRSELEALAASFPEQFRVHFLLAEPNPGWRGETGLLTAGLIRRLTDSGDEKSFFISGPPGMHRHLAEELAGFGLPQGRIRSEACGEEQVALRSDFPAAAAGQTFTLLVSRGGSRHSIPARGDETVLSALERAGLAPPSQCRSGICGWCRSLLVSGRVFVLPEADGRRLADRRFGYFHPCSSYPLSDLEIRVPDNPLPGAAAKQSKP
jgi:ferredoxin-NADP reductase